MPQEPYLLPPALKLGDTIRVVAPAGSFSRTLFYRGVSWLRQFFRVEYAPDVFDRLGGTAGSRERRLSELNAALSSETAKAIWCVRGGYGCSELSSLANFKPLLRAPKWLIGFSDITALHCELNRLRIASLHAPNVTSVALGWEALRAATLRVVLAPQRTREFKDLEMLYDGDALGPSAGGNLTLLLQEVSLGRYVVPDNAVIFLEEVNEVPYRVARKLAALERAGAFDRAAAVVFCQVSAQYAGTDAAYREVLTAFARRVRVPTRWGAPIGHYLRQNEPLVLGSPAAVVGERVLLNPS